MGKKYQEISPQHMEFIARQKLFFCATAAPDGRVNMSPKGGDSLRVLDPVRAIWLNLTGSGNETSAHLLENPRMTLMFCAFEAEPKILRLYGSARTITPENPEWTELYSYFEPDTGARQIFDLSIDLVQSSCGFGVPYFDYAGERDALRQWSQRKGEEGVHEYWRLKNTQSIDGKEAVVAHSVTSIADSDAVSGADSADGSAADQDESDNLPADPPDNHASDETGTGSEESLPK
ncbi:MAG: hypothetical protein DHS20C01_04000 [marine bacterium B5-7]|nr:MAG: hypothetical protein DHS20C01_04000 [marine bacterium B5-7]